jgi:hypothetical protein
MRDGNDCIEKIPLPARAANIAFGLAGGLPYQPWAAELVKQARGHRDARRSACQVPAVVRPSQLHPAALPEVLPVARRAPDAQRVQRQLPAESSSMAGHCRSTPAIVERLLNCAVGREALVIETTGFRDDLWLDMRGNPLTSAARVTERLTRPEFGRLQIELTVDDPKATLARGRCD